MAAISPRIETERLILRRLAPTDASELAAVLAENRDHLGGRVPLPATDADLAAVLAGLARRFDEGEHAAYAITAQGRMVGMISLALDVHPPEVGYWLAASATGTGLATEAVRGVCAMARELGLARLRIRCAHDNPGSRAVAERAGFGSAADAWRAFLVRIGEQLPVTPGPRGTATIRVGGQWVDLRLGRAEGELWVVAAAPVGDLEPWDAVQLGATLEIGALAVVDGTMVLRATAPLATTETAWLVEVATRASRLSRREVPHAV